jgi:hypothetical protein
MPGWTIWRASQSFFFARGGCGWATRCGVRLGARRFSQRAQLTQRSGTCASGAELARYDPGRALPAAGGAWRASRARGLSSRKGCTTHERLCVLGMPISQGQRRRQLSERARTTGSGRRWRAGDTGTAGGGGSSARRKQKTTRMPTLSNLSR